MTSTGYFMPSELRIESRELGSAISIELTGCLDHTNVSRLNRAIQASLRHNVSEIILDLGNVSWLDSRAIGQFMVYRQQMEKSAKKLVLANCKGDLLAALRLVSYHKLFEMR